MPTTESGTDTILISHEDHGERAERNNGDERRGQSGGELEPEATQPRETTTAMPTRRTSFPSVPLFQPVTDRVGPSTDSPEYQLVNDDTASTRPLTHVTSAPTESTPGPRAQPDVADPAGRRRRALRLGH